MWNVEAEDILISLVREKPVLFQASQGKHKDRICIENIFKEISYAMTVMCPHFGAHSCEEQWKKLRETYCRHKRSLKKPSGAKGGEIKPIAWPHFLAIDAFCSDQLKFRKPRAGITNYVQASSGSSNIDEIATVSLSPEAEEASQNSSKKIDTDEASQASPNFVSGHKKRRKSCDPADLDAQISSVSHKIGDLVDVIGQQKSKKEQPADWVSMALAEDLKKLPTDLRVKAQAEMFGVLAKYTEMAVNRVSVQENVVKSFNFHDYC
ncbi:hypothetical protein QYM36_018351 [Artemia franciscana]|uniref:MADF domain-containing protein n=1 Tax=Artemia franciscana TaxID=6661 RepID=A0AA88H6S8_ARTSF|nr:hypothetical protein QYM36_018351 [Artemia franciscana]KAK2703117.1 hypothetical protein QYM36_018351 [Artemia franciscana]